MVDVSIILPVYNAGCYLVQCLDSLVNQTLKNIEIIVVLDCPIDGSDKIVEKYEQQDDRIIVIRNKQNLHIGMSRNEGLKVAKGKYVAFCDHDDYCDEDMYRKMYVAMEKGDYDLLVTPYVSLVNGNLYSYGYPSLSPEKLQQSILVSAIGICSRRDPMLRFNLSGAIWNKLFKNDIIKSNKLTFVDTNIATFEDLIFLIEYSYFAKNAFFLDRKLYFYRKEVGLSSTSTYYQPKKVRMFIDILYDFLNDKNIFCKYEKRFYNTVRLFVLKSVMYIVLDSMKKKDFYCLKSNMSLFNNSTVIVKSFQDGYNTCFVKTSLFRKFYSFLFAKYYLYINRN